MFKNLGIESSESGTINTNFDKMTTGLYLYDNLLGLTFSVCEIFHLLKESKVLDDETTTIAKSIVKSLEESLKKLESRTSEVQDHGEARIRKLVEKTKSHLECLLNGIEFNQYSLKLKEFLLSHELIALYKNKNYQTTTLYSIFSDIMNLQMATQAVINHRNALTYMDHLLPVSSCIYKRYLMTDLGASFNKGLIRVERLYNLGGFVDVFNIDIILIINSLLDMTCMIVEITNNTKIFFEEIIVTVMVSNVEYSNGEKQFFLEDFAANSKRKIKICLVKKSFDIMTTTVDITSKILAKIKSENQQIIVEKLESLAGIGDIFEKKSLSKASGIKFHPLKFMMPLDLSRTPNHTIQMLRERLVYSANLTHLTSKLMERMNSKPQTPIKKAASSESEQPKQDQAQPTQSVQRILLPLEKFDSSSIFKNYIIILEATTGPIFIKDNIKSQYEKLEALYTSTQNQQSPNPKKRQQQPSISSSLNFFFSTSSDDIICLTIQTILDTSTSTLSQVARLSSTSHKCTDISSSGSSTISSMIQSCIGPRIPARNII